MIGQHSLQRQIPPCHITTWTSRVVLDKPRPSFHEITLLLRPDFETISTDNVTHPRVQVHRVSIRIPRSTQMTLSRQVFLSTSIERPVHHRVADVYTDFFIFRVIRIATPSGDPTTTSSHQQSHPFKPSLALSIDEIRHTSNDRTVEKRIATRTDVDRILIAFEAATVEAGVGGGLNAECCGRSELILRDRESVENLTLGKVDIVRFEVGTLRRGRGEEGENNGVAIVQRRGGVALIDVRGLPDSNLVGEGGGGGGCDAGKDRGGSTCDDDLFVVLPGIDEDRSCDVVVWSAW